jgi:hypothetical protein
MTSNAGIRSCELGMYRALLGAPDTPPFAEQDAQELSGIAAFGAYSGGMIGGSRGLPTGYYPSKFVSINETSEYT